MDTVTTRKRKRKEARPPLTFRMSNGAFDLLQELKIELEAKTGVTYNDSQLASAIFDYGIAPWAKFNGLDKIVEAHQKSKV